MKYQEPQPMPRPEAELALQSGDSMRACDALVSIACHDPDWQWVQSWCIALLKSHDVAIKGLAATCIGHIARIHGKLELEQVAPALESALQDAEIRGRVEDAISDIKVFMGIDPLA